MRLYRGIRLPIEGLPPVDKGMELAHTSNPLSSWSLHRDTSAHFAGATTYQEKGLLLYMEVPAERIAATAVTGMGCITEQEIVLIGGQPDVARIVEVLG